MTAEKCLDRIVKAGDYDLCNGYIGLALQKEKKYIDFFTHYGHITLRVCAREQVRAHMHILKSTRMQTFTCTT